MSSPIAVLISDVHYNINTLEIADKAMRLAIDKANDLYVPLVVCGDLHDTKANLRGECVNAIIQTFNSCELKATVLVGNHDKINEKSKDNSLGFLKGHVNFIVDKPGSFDAELIDGSAPLGHVIPYYHDSEELKKYLLTISKGSRLIMHQGVIGSNAGHYIQDKSALPKELFSDFRVISGHYHARQDIETGRPQKNGVGLWSYLGNPYTLSFGEAKDPEKGFHILYDDGMLEFIPTNLRRHIIHETDPTVLGLATCPKVRKEDLLWVKVTGQSELREKFTKEYVREWLGIHKDQGFKFDYYSLETKAKIDTPKNQTQAEVLDELIQSLTNTSEEQKIRIKQLWKDLL